MTHDSFKSKLTYKSNLRVASVADRFLSTLEFAQ